MLNKIFGQDKDITINNFRYETFGGILSIQNPDGLVFVDKEFMKELGYEYSPSWDNNTNYLCAPTEVHFNVTNFCPMKCDHCTTSAVNTIDNTLSFKRAKEIIDILAQNKVFHIAFGGGELFSRPDAIEIAKYAASKGIVPNATTNGYYMTPELAKECKIFGQINISIDGIGEKYSIIRGCNYFDKADNAVRLLHEQGVSVGINCMACRDNFDYLEEVVRYAHKLGLAEVLFLRLKPSGRAKNLYQEHRLTKEQGKKFFKNLLKYSRKYSPNILVDCSFVPHICYHKPSKKLMKTFGISGCDGGNILMGLREDGMLNACSHYDEYIDNIDQLKNIWNNHKHFTTFRERKVSNNICTKCSYFDVCRGGCPLFAEHISGDFNSVDPECPIIEANPDDTGGRDTGGRFFCVI
jgi:radical SAM protein with 4Fe4S-binding SPASM domain